MVRYRVASTFLTCSLVGLVATSEVIASSSVKQFDVESVTDAVAPSTDFIKQGAQNLQLEHHICPPIFDPVCGRHVGSAPVLYNNDCLRDQDNAMKVPRNLCD